MILVSANFTAEGVCLIVNKLRPAVRPAADQAACGTSRECDDNFRIQGLFSETFFRSTRYAARVRLNIYCTHEV